ncbi:hypothetical protein ACVKN3_000690 [Luteibacter sp. PvP120]
MFSVFTDLTIFQAIMIGCAVLTGGVIFALLKHVPKTPATRRLRGITTFLAFVLIATSICERLGWIH